MPWALEPDSKRSIHYLQDILCDLPGLAEDATTLLDLNASEEASSYKQVCCRIISSLQELYTWRWKWEAECPNSCYEVKSSRSCDIFSTILHFKDPNHASLITHYNAILLVLLRLQGALQIPHSSAAEGEAYGSSQFQANNNFGNALFLPGQAKSETDIARELCRSIEYQLLGVGGRAGAYNLLFPLRIAHQTFDYTSAEAIWLRQIMIMIADDSGFELARHLATVFLLAQPAQFRRSKLSELRGLRF